MNLRTRIASVVGALALAGAAAYAPAASADRVGFNVTFGGPGYAVNLGNAGYGYGYGYGHDYWRPAPVVVAPYVPYYRPHRPYYYVPVVPVVRPYPIHRHHRHYDSDSYHGHRPYGHRPAGYVYHR